MTQSKMHRDIPQNTSFNNVPKSILQSCCNTYPATQAAIKVEQEVLMSTNLELGGNPADSGKQPAGSELRRALPPRHLGCLGIVHLLRISTPCSMHITHPTPHYELQVLSIHQKIILILFAPHPWIHLSSSYHSADMHVEEAHLLLRWTRIIPSAMRLQMHCKSIC